MGPKLKFNPFKERRNMKSYFFLIALYFFFGSQVAFSQSPPSVEFSSQVMNKLSGRKQSGPNQGILDCQTLLLKAWPYPNAQVAPLCNDALYSCIRYGLIEQRIKAATGNTLELLKKDIALAANDTQMTLRGCQLAIESTLTNKQSLLEAAGYSSKSKR